MKDLFWESLLSLSTLVLRALVQKKVLLTRVWARKLFPKEFISSTFMLSV